MDIYRQILERILNAYAPVGVEAASSIFDAGEMQSFMKNEKIFHERRFNGFEYFQLEGVSHRYNINNESEIVTTGIYQGEAVITPHFARTSNGQVIFSLQALTDCTYLRVPAGIFRELLAGNQQIQVFGRMVIEKEFARSLNFEVLFRSFSAKDRLLYFRKNYQQLENLIPHTIIASFLGITQVSFSRLRKELARGK